MNEHFNELKDRIKPEILSRLDEKEPETLYPLINDYFQRGGKLFRPVLCMLGCELTGGKVSDVIPTACGLEFFHNFALIHDDIEDKSRLRRGRECLHRIHGVPLSVNAGDGLLIKTYEVLLENKGLLGCEKCVEVLECFNEGIMTTIEGQAMDIGWVEEEDYTVGIEDYMKMAGKKTGVYTGSLPLSLGGVVAGASDEELRKLKEFGSRMAVAFQIKDDLLNLTGSEEEYGKEIGGDLNEGKRTLMIIHYLQNADTEEREWMKRLLEEDDNSQEKLKEGINRLKKQGSVGFAEEKARSLVNEGLTYLNGFPESEAKKTLIELGKLVIEREK